MVLLLAGCQTTNVPPATSSTAALEEDERRLWLRAREEQATLDQSGLVLGLPAATDYLDTLVARLQAQPLPNGARLRTRIVADPTLNAFALPDGTIYIHTGMLAQLENEAQLATVLAHELSHTTHRHALRGWRQLKNQTGFMVSFAIGTGGIGGLLGWLGAATAVSGYSQELESEADQLGFARLVQEGYDPRESPKVFRLLLAESKRSKIKEPYFFASHPRLTERIENFDALVARLPAAQRQGRLGSEEYRAVMVPVFVANAGVAAQSGDFDAALRSGQRVLEFEPLHRGALLAQAETLRRRGHEQDRSEAMRVYRQLTTFADCPPEAHRGLGLVLFKTGDRAAAAASFRHYLAAQPQAADRGHILNQLQQCENSSSL